jgi:hypothetical protein
MENEILPGNDSESPLFKKDTESKTDGFSLDSESPYGLNIKIKSKELFQSKQDYPTEDLAGVFFRGTQYFDFSNVKSLSNSVLAKLIYLCKSMLQKGISVKLVNVRAEIKNKIKSMGLDKIFFGT